MRERGLKQKYTQQTRMLRIVVLLAGTWIETPAGRKYLILSHVVPLAGTWIETTFLFCTKKLKVCRSPCGNVD